MIADFTYYRLLNLQALQTENTAHAPSYFFKLQYAQKGIDAVEISKKKIITKSSVLHFAIF